MNVLAICICTCNRIRLLEELLKACSRLNTPSGWRLKVFVVDNDPSRSARLTTLQQASKSPVSIHYDMEPIKNIARSRNRVIHNALSHGCGLLAMIDDDELPGENWLTDLYDALGRYGCDGVLGPVYPRCQSRPPLWMIRTRFLQRTFASPGSTLQWFEMRTGNVLLKTSILDGHPEPFDPRFGESGGEDLDFFKRMTDKGRRFVGVNSGEVYEFIPEQRMSLSHMATRAYIQGSTSIRLRRKHGLTGFGMAAQGGKSLAAVLLYSATLPFLVFQGRVGLAKITPRLFFHLGRLRQFACGSESVTREEFRLPRMS